MWLTMYFLGYDSEWKAYILLTLDDLSKNVCTPRDVSFFDHTFQNLNKTMQISWYQTMSLTFSSLESIGFGFAMVFLASSL